MDISKSLWENPFFMVLLPRIRTIYFSAREDMHSLTVSSLVDFTEKKIEWLINLVTDLLISLSEQWHLMLKTHVSLGYVWTSRCASAVLWNKVHRYQCWTATNNSWMFCFFLLLLIFKASSSMRNTATFWIVESQVLIYTFCCCFLSASVKVYLAFTDFYRPL